jgi:hypothetical protein
MSEEITALSTTRVKLLIANVIKKREELNAEVGYWNAVLTVLYGELKMRKGINLQVNEEEANGKQE